MQITAWALCAMIAAAQGTFLAFVLGLKKENRLPNRLLGAMLMLLSVTLTEWALWWTGLIEEVPAIKGMTFGFPLLFGPLMFLFYQATFEQKPLSYIVLFHFLPFTLAVFLMLPFYLRFFEDLSEGLKWIPPLTRRPWFPALIFAQMIGYGVWIGVRFRPWFLEKTELRRWHRWLLAAYYGIIITYLLYRLLPFLGLTAQEWKYFIAFSLTAFIYLTAWLGYIEPRVFAGIPLKKAIIPGKYRKSSLHPESSAALFANAEKLMEEEQLFRDSRLSLNTFAAKLNEQRHRLSQAINEQSGKSFSEWVNGYRITAARELLAHTSKREKNVIEVAYEVGFNSKNAFNLAFKNLTGMTPTEFRQSRIKG